jgi:phosphoribosylformylglycinamidine cyclo-ligase
LEAMREGDLLIGLPSSGPHTNGYSLIRQAVAGRDLAELLEDGQTLADALLSPHRAYLQEVDRIQAAGLPLHGLAHITGGGLLENVPRVLPEHLAAEIELQSWTPPPLFRHLVEWSGMQGIEPYRVLNMGIGMVCIVPADGVRAYTELLPESVVIGRLVPRQEQAIRLL